VARSQSARQSARAEPRPRELPGATLPRVIRVLVPATSANLGPGFDCLGLAIDLHLEVEGRPAAADLFRYSGEGTVPETADNLVHAGFRAAHEAAGRVAPPFAFEVRNSIPLARGLGSSSAALVAGAAIADALMEGALGREGVFQCVAALEGHPDNVGPAVFGGLTVAALREGGGYEAAVLRVPPSWRLLFGVPDFELPTERARAVLPETVRRSDAVLTASRAALWALAVARDEPHLLRTASLDVLHEPYREGLVPGLAAARAELRAAGAYAAFLSGAGPSVGVVAPPEALAACRAALARFAGERGRVLEVGVGEGYTLSAVAPRAP
jgi:homoserine kinase